MSDVKINKLNEVFLQLEVSNDIAMEIHESFKVFIPNHVYMKLFIAKLWDGRSSFFDFNRFTIPIGFLKKLKEFCSSYNYTYEMTFDESTLSNTITDEEINKFLTTILPSTSDFKLREYQEIAIREMIKANRAMCEMATGSGKSLVIFFIVKYLQMIGMKGKFILIVPSISLVNQMSSDFKEYGFPDFDKVFGTIYFDSSNRDLSKQFLISTWQTLVKLPQSFLDGVEAFCVDEVHGSSFKSKLLVNVLSNFKNAKYRWGCTGTLPKEEINIGSLVGYIGKIVSTVKSKELIDKKVLSQLQVVNILLKYPKNMIDKSGKFQDEIEKINHYADRNKIFKYIINKVGETKNVLILVQRIEHLRLVREYLQREFPTRDIYEIFGGTDGDERERIRKIVNKSKGAIICSTYKTTGQGINIPNLNCVIFGSSYKESKTIIQATGRILRKTDIKTKATLFDVVDDLTWLKKTGVIGKNYVYEHFLDRLRVYREEQFPYKTISINISEI